MMSSRRSSSRRSGVSSIRRISDDQIADLVCKLQQLLPAEIRVTPPSTKVSASKVLQETCNSIKSLRSEVDNLSHILSELLESTDDVQADLVKSLLSTVISY